MEKKILTGSVNLTFTAKKNKIESNLTANFTHIR